MVKKKSKRNLSSYPQYLIHLAIENNIDEYKKFIMDNQIHANLGYGFDIIKYLRLDGGFNLGLLELKRQFFRQLNSQFISEKYG